MGHPIELPQEIYELFVDAIGREVDLYDDKETLAALLCCSQVSRVFWLQARRHIFSHIYICGSGRRMPRVTAEHRLVKFLDIATASLEGVHCGISLVQSFSLLNQHDNYALWDHPAFLELLKLLIAETKLKSFSMHGSTGAWTGLLPQVQQSICDLIQAPNMKSFGLRNFTDVPSDIFNGSRLTHLTLHSRSGSLPTVPLADLPSPPPLESISTNNEVPIVSLPLRQCFPNLKRISSIISQPLHLEIACHLARESSQSLTTLDLTFIYCVYLPPAECEFNLGQFPNLLHLRLGFSTDPAVISGGTEYLKDLCHYLSRPLGWDTPLPLQSINIHITLPHEIHRTVPSLNKDHWRAVDKAITKPHLSNVRRVHVHLHFMVVGMIYGTGFAESVFVNDTKELARPLFARTDRSQSIDFSLEVTVEFVGRGILPVF